MQSQVTVNVEVRYPFFPQRLFITPTWEFDQEIGEPGFIGAPVCGCFGSFLHGYYAPAGNGLTRAIHVMNRTPEQKEDESEEDYWGRVFNNICLSGNLQLNYVEGIEGFINALVAYDIEPQDGIARLGEYAGSDDPFGPDDWEECPYSVMNKFNGWVAKQNRRPSDGWLRSQTWLDQNFNRFLHAWFGGNYGKVLTLDIMI